MENELPNPERLPTTADLVTLCRALNEAGARYVVIGGFAINTTATSVRLKISTF